MDPVKVAAGGVVAAGIGVGGYGVSTLLTGEPGRVHIKTAGTEGHLSFDFQHHFVDASDSENDKWWDWSFKNRYSGKTDLSSEFGSGVGDGSQLKSKCLAAYSKEIKTHIHSDTEEADKKKYEKDIWTLCSIEGDKPITIEETLEKEPSFKVGATHASKFGGTNKKHVISTQDERNNKFWKIQAQAFFQSTNGLGSKATVENSEFKSLYASTEKSKRTSEELKNACKTRYEAEPEDNKNKETFRFCSLKGKQD
ncbi:hypothetical protein MHSWG343_05190 [Candidatus Mycoplasma haematohominis]|uniref:Uncharacterized protein n=1 Tax=Candidatus Mycoplasma haematohominis TaxID=1494318 RepID=A0A478FQD0_9MOLU|nr:hypothetical protein MHSWG343_05190 [Candidatus Mycoplasma haemohominis]